MHLQQIERILTLKQKGKKSILENKTAVRTAIRFVIAAVWLINGLFCKLLNMVPRHQLIVARILGSEHAGLFTKAIGIAEIAMFAWVVSGISPKFCALTQILIVAAMNAIEFFAASDLLLFGKINAIVAFAFIVLIFYNEFNTRKTVSTR